MRLAFCGKLASGKSTSCTVLQDYGSFQIVTFKQRVEIFMKHHFPTHPIHPHTINLIQQTASIISPDIWVETLIQSLETEHNVIVDGVWTKCQCQKLR